MPARPPAAFSDSDWTRDPPRPPLLPASQRRALTLAVAIALASVGLALLLYGVEQWFDTQQRLAPRPAASSVAPAPVAVVPAPPPAASAPVIAAAPPPPSAPRAERRELDALEAEMKQRAREASEQAAAEAVRRRERAWERFYQRPAFCNENPTSAQMIECANQYIRARKTFEERYPSGRL